MSKTLILALFAACALVTSLPTEEMPTAEDVVNGHMVPGGFPAAPKVSFLQKQQEEDHKVAKKKVANLLSQGSDENACSEMAQTALDEVTASVQLQQDVLDNMDKGAGCDYAGDAVKSQAAAHLNATGIEVSNAQADVHAAESTSIDLGTYEWSSLDPNNCAAVINNNDYQSATAQVNSARNTLNEKNGVYAAAEQGITDAENEAQMLISECKCKVITAQQDARTTMNADVKDANEKAWHQAKHIQCVLAGTAASNCDLGTIPSVEETTVAEGVMDGCGGAPFKATLGENGSNVQWEKQGVGTRSYTFRPSEVQYPEKGNDFNAQAQPNNGLCGSDKAANDWFPVCEHPSYCKLSAFATYIGQDHHISHGSHMNENSYFPPGWPNIRINWYGQCMWSNYANGGTALCNNDAGGNGNAYQDTGAPWGSHSWLHPSDTQGTGRDGKPNEARRFMCGRIDHKEVTANIGSRNSQPARTISFKVKSRDMRKYSGEFADQLVSACADGGDDGWQPVCEHPSYCNGDAKSIYVGQDNHFSHGSHRNELSYWPSGWDTVLQAIETEMRGPMCTYSAGANGRGSMLCGADGGSHQWLSNAQSNQFLCAKVH